MNAHAPGPWLAWSRSGHVGGNSDSIDHGTTDGRTTLCGLKEIGGSVREVPFDPERAFSCVRCAAAFDAAAAAIAKARKAK